ncbi:MAG: hypothetical protein QNJ00_09860 [Woeseiaceae bacterium]|nr:hypothetical protein [Woeseiaceae bacterium]
MILCLRRSLLAAWLVLGSTALGDEPRRAIDSVGIQLFIESHRSERHGPGKILASSRGYYDGDSYPDRLVIYTYGHGPNRGDKDHGMYAVAFLTDNFENTQVLFIPESEMLSSGISGYSSDGTELVITGEKRLPGDAMCCPSAIASIALTVADGQVVVLNGEYRRQPDRD